MITLCGILVLTSIIVPLNCVTIQNVSNTKEDLTAELFNAIGDLRKELQETKNEVTELREQQKLDNIKIVNLEKQNMKMMNKLHEADKVYETVIDRGVHRRFILPSVEVGFNAYMTGAPLVLNHNNIVPFDKTSVNDGMFLLTQKSKDTLNQVQIYL